MTAGGCGDVRERALGGFQDFEQVFADQGFDFGDVAELVAFYALADALQDFGGGVGADVGGDEGVFDLFEDVGVDFLAAADGVF